VEVRNLQLRTRFLADALLGLHGSVLSPHLSTM
jgi:hypothetical protein